MVWYVVERRGDDDMTWKHLLFSRDYFYVNENFYDQKISENGTVFSHFVLKTSQETWLVFFYL